MLKPKKKGIGRPMDHLNLDLNPSNKKVTFSGSPDKYQSKGEMSVEEAISALALSGPGHTMQQKNAKLANEYAKRHERM